MSRKKRILWKFYPAFLLTAIVSIFVVTWYGAASFTKFHREQTKIELEALARVCEMQIDNYLSTGQEEKVREYVEEAGERAGVRITVVLFDGKVIAESSKDEREMESHADRPEIIQALKGSVGEQIRFSRTIQTKMMYVAAPILAENRLIGAVRTSRPLLRIENALNQIYWRMVLVAAAAVILTALISLIISRQITQPLNEIQSGAERISSGDYHLYIRDPEILELSSLAAALNKLAADTSARIVTITQQRNELEAILKSMSEGVLAVDRDERVIIVNDSCVAMLNIGFDEIVGASFDEVVRNTTLHKLVKNTIRNKNTTTTEITFYGTETERFLQVNAAPLFDQAQSCIGVVIVLNDITNIRILENVRKEFVANVSHELRTPITALKGFVETLLSGAANEPESAERFLRIIEKHADRLNAIIDDLLLLSQMEASGSRETLELSKWRIVNTFNSAFQFCQMKAGTKNIAITVDCPEELTAFVNPRLFEHVVINLLDNAINYSDADSTIWLSCRQEGDEVLVAVRDEGSGIAKTHLARIFERFYRVDRSRSRELGGTGLGLAIVKHVVQAHGGRITVESEIGEGSTFTIHLPLQPSAEPPKDTRSG